MRTGALIVYTSADSVFQIAAHEDDRAGPGAVSRLRDRLRAGRRGARRRPRDRAAVRRRAGRVQAHREPPRLRAAAVGRDAARSPQGARRCRSSRSARSRICSRAAASRTPSTPRATTTAWTRSSGRWRTLDRGLHLHEPRRLRHAVRPPQRRRRLRARTSSASTRGSPALLPRLRDDDLLVVTADHGNDPTTPSTDHAREYVPLLVTGARVARRRRPRHARDVRRPRPDAGRAVRRRRARARHELPAGDHT